MTPAVDAIVRAAEDAGATVVRSPAGVVIVIPTNAPSPDELLPLDRAAAVAATSVRVVRDAIRAGALPAVGRQRDRAVRRRDLDAWVESRRAALVQVSDDQAERVEARLRRRGRR